MSDSILKQVIDGDSPVESNSDSKIAHISEMELNRVYILFNQRTIKTRNGPATIGELKDFDTRDTFTAFLPGSLVKKLDSDGNYYLVNLGKKTIKTAQNNYQQWDIRCKSIMEVE